MADRLGLRPWERDTMSPREIRSLYDGMVWRSQRIARALGLHAYLVRACWTNEDKLEDVTDSFLAFMELEK